MSNKRLRPNIVRGGVAIPIPNKKNYYYMKGRKHEQGGIDIGKNPRTGLEVEDGEVMHISPTEVKVFSSVPFLNGESPAEKVMKGNNPNKVFNAQERYKDVNNINDDGTKNNRNRKNKSRYGTKKNDFEKIREIQSLANNVSTLENPIISPDYTPYYDTTEVGKLINHSENPDSIGFDKVTRRWYAPKGKGFDKDNFGMGVDRYTGGNINDKIKKDSKGREYITEEDERDLRFKRIKSANQSAKRRIDFIRKYYNDEGDVTETKEALVTNLIYNRGSGKTARVYFNTEDKKYVPMQRAILRGTDDEVRKEINKIYREAGLANRDSLVNDFYKRRNKKRIGGLIWKKRGYNSLISDGIGIASNIVGSIIGYNANKKALKKMKYNKAPVNLIPSKLKTSININPQLDTIRDQQQAYERQIDANTASSRVALGRKQLGRLNTIKLLNNIYANKENTETELINKDRLNQQAVANQNITNYNTWKEKKNAFENAIIEKQSENTIGLINSINAGVQNAIGNFEKRLAAENNIRAIAAANPNVNPIILKALGVRGITNDMIESWLRAYGNKNN